MNATNSDGLIPVYPNATNLNFSQPYLGFNGVLYIMLPQNYTQGTEISVEVFYSTPFGVAGSNNGAGLNYVLKQNTPSRTQPAMFSYTEPTLTRTFIPIQDTPAIKITYGACVIVDQGLSVYMSANKTGTFYSKPGYYKHCFH